MFLLLVTALVLLGFAGSAIYSAETYGQHSGAGVGALTVEYLRTRLQHEYERMPSTGRHALRTPDASLVPASISAAA